RALPPRRRRRGLSPGVPVLIGHGDVSLREGDSRRSNLANQYDGGEHGSGGHSGRPQVVVQVSPPWIESIDEVHLFLPRTALDLLLSFDCPSHITAGFVKDKPVNLVAFGESFNQSFP